MRAAPWSLNRPLVIGLGMHDLINRIHAMHYMQCKALWTKVTAKCLNVKYCHEIQAFVSHTSIKSAPHTLLKIRLLYWHLWLHEESQISIAQKVLYSEKKNLQIIKRLKMVILRTVQLRVLSETKKMFF